MTLTSTACSWVNIDGTKTVSFAQAGQIHFGGAGQFCIGGDSHRHGLMVGARSFPGNPYDGHTLAAQVEQNCTLLQDLGVRPTTAIVDLGYRGVDKEVAPVEVIHRGKSKSLAPVQKTWLRRRQAIEPLIGHTKADHRMDRCWLRGAEGDALHAVLCAAGFNIRWLLRAVVRLGLERLFFDLIMATLRSGFGARVLTTSAARAAS